MAQTARNPIYHNFMSPYLLQFGLRGMTEVVCHFFSVDLVTSTHGLIPT